MTDFNITVVGSDLNGKAIAKAELGIYSLSVFDDAWLEKIHDYFDMHEQQLKVKPGIRQLCQFTVENIIDNHPSDLLDVVSCRNLLIYLKSELQDKLIRRFYERLQPGGLLFLGQSESIGLIGNTLFSPLDHYHRIYRCKKSTI